MTITENAPIAKHIYAMTLRAGGLNCVPGQFAHVAVPGYLLRRPISIAGYANDAMTLIYQVKGNGTHTMSGMKPGEDVNTLAPLGRGFDGDGINKNYYAVGGGLGVAPMMYAAKTYGCRAFFGFRNRAVAFGYEDAHFCSDDGSLGQKGFVTQLLSAAIAEKRPEGIIACGPEVMLRAVKNIAIAHDLKCCVSLEARMGCGVGACLTCACKSGASYARVCADGPVFDALEVEF